MSTKRDELCQLHLQICLIFFPPLFPPWFAILMQRQSSQWETANWKGWLIISWIFIIQLFFIEKWLVKNIFLLRLLFEPCCSTESCADSSPRSSAPPRAQHKYLQIQTHSELINSVCPPTSAISFIPSDTHAQEVFVHSACANMRESHKRERGRLN